MPSFWLDDQDHRQALALVRKMELRPGGMVWGKLLDALETDRPRADVVPLACIGKPCGMPAIHVQHFYNDPDNNVRYLCSGVPTPLASRRVDLDDPKWETGRRVTRMERLGQAEARAQKGGVL